MDFYLKIAFIICALLCSNIVANQTLQTTNRSTKSHINVKVTKMIFKQHCAKCHGTDGRGRTVEGEIAGAQDLTDQDWQHRVEEQRIINSITHGRGQMPAFEKKLSKEQIKSLSAFVMTFKD